MIVRKTLPNYGQQLPADYGMNVIGLNEPGSSLSQGGAVVIVPWATDTPRCVTNLTASSLNSRLNFLLVTICHLQFHLPP